MSAVFTYSYIDSKKNIRIATHSTGSIDNFIKFVIHNKEFIIWANLIDSLNGAVLEKYVNIKNYQGNNMENFNLSLKGPEAEIYKKVYIIHRLEFEQIVAFIKSIDIDYFNKLVENKAFKMISLSKFFKSDLAEQFFVFPAKHYDLIMGEFAMKLTLSETADFQELLPIAKTIDIQIEIA